MSLFQKAAYAISVAGPNDPYPASVGEVAFAGRSNAGKSSAINTLVGQKRLAFVSKTPGRTQMINYFSLDYGHYLVDLPGYGYANVPDKIRSQWEKLLSTYLKHRDALKGLVLVMDIRHAFSDLDWQLIDFFSQTGKPIHALLTKADKLSRTQAHAALAEARETLGKVSTHHTAQLFSSLKRTGMEETEEVLCRWLGLAPESRAPAIRPSPAGNKKPRA
jgi:GTP-binding protein